LINWPQRGADIIADTPYTALSTASYFCVGRRHSSQRYRISTATGLWTSK